MLLWTCPWPHESNCSSGLYCCNLTQLARGVNETFHEVISRSRPITSQRRQEKWKKRGRTTAKPVQEVSIFLHLAGIARVLDRHVASFLHSLPQHVVIMASLRGHPQNGLLNLSFSFARPYLESFLPTCRAIVFICLWTLQFWTVPRVSGVSYSDFTSHGVGGITANKTEHTQCHGPLPFWVQEEPTDLMAFPPLEESVSWPTLMTGSRWQTSHVTLLTNNRDPDIQLATPALTVPVPISPLYPSSW